LKRNLKNLEKKIFFVATSGNKEDEKRHINHLYVTAESGKLKSAKAL
jgi:hypothetical protein